jgi:hypothetical protein
MFVPSLSWQIFSVLKYGMAPKRRLRTDCVEYVPKFNVRDRLQAKETVKETVKEMVKETV